jgi:hypothetical protein
MTIYFSLFVLSVAHIYGVAIYSVVSSVAPYTVDV